MTPRDLDEIVAASVETARRDYADYVRAVRHWLLHTDAEA